ncbi:hypothetical protein FML35_07825 [Klebsiella oxytoca]|nr:hypothetical protein HMPREF1570_4263 [Klebsiella oxytoca KA-2]MBZ7278335.1 hypothetical protein [Klebsiella oxytoca]MBZ7715071.1 hypothetical protein [Klebsiella oxytoca]
MRSIASGNVCHVLHVSPGGGATRLARATGPQTAGNLQPGQMRSIASGNVCHVLHVSPGGRRNAPCPSYETADGW